jgi:protein tyrosine phosphatase (PTP) superfamily phosphohydrolase (DUF442 family)
LIPHRDLHRRSIVFFLPVVFLAGCSTVGRDIAGIHNFDRVSSMLYRGGQPTRQGVATLRQLGIVTIINLRDDPNRDEPSWAWENGMRYIWIPCSPFKVEPAKLCTFLGAIRTSPGPIFVHCQLGRDRTGVDVAIYRMIDEGWSRKCALEDLHQHGQQWLLFPEIARYIKTFDPREFVKCCESAGYFPGTSSKNPTPSRLR